MSIKGRLIFALILAVAALLVFFLRGAMGHELENAMSFTISLTIIIALSVIFLRKEIKGIKKKHNNKHKQNI